jgi:hypothetical protein
VSGTCSFDEAPKRTVNFARRIGRTIRKFSERREEYISEQLATNNI